jgi:hypothetical protein
MENPATKACESDCYGRMAAFSAVKKKGRSERRKSGNKKYIS